MVVLVDRFVDLIRAARVSFQSCRRFDIDTEDVIVRDDEVEPGAQVQNNKEDG